MYSGFAGMANTVASGLHSPSLNPPKSMKSGKGNRKKKRNSEYKFKIRKRPRREQYENKVLGFIQAELKKIPEIKYVLGDWLVSLENRLKAVFFQRDILKCVNCKLCLSL